MKIDGGFCAGGMRFTVDGKLYEIGENEHYHEWKKGRIGGPQDKWRYTLPDGESYSHPTLEGALWMCTKHIASRHVADP